MLCTWQGNSNIGDPRLANIEQYKALAAAIIATAADDYIYAVRVNSKREIERLERFFNSDEFILFSDGEYEPKAVISALRHRAKRR